MRAVAKVFGLAAFALTAGCEVNVDNNLAAAAETQVEALGNDLGAAAEDAGNTLGQAGEVVGNQVGAVTNGVDVDVDLGGDNEAANANKQ